MVYAGPTGSDRSAPTCLTSIRRSNLHRQRGGGIVRLVSFRRNAVFEGHDWYNPPAEWSVEGGVLRFTTLAETDFWNNTHYGFRHGNGHVFARPVAGDFSAEAVFSAEYVALYDQAGVMLRVDDDNWLKTGIEFTDGLAHFSVVVTRADQSDWSVIPLPAEAMAEMQVRLTRHGDALRVQYRFGDRSWAMARLAFLDMPESVAVGPAACSPIGAGLTVQFQRFAIGPAISRDLHD
ncbi:MAG: DUF1349 domain-containing protein [Alphaproteobacteria bacterium]|nr:DUF1349 domain-containing protein [Alphaproteobacteria bacterium]